MDSTILKNSIEMDKTLKKKSRNLTQDELRKMMKQKQKCKGSTLKLNKRPSSSAILSKVSKNTCCVNFLKYLETKYYTIYQPVINNFR